VAAAREPHEHRDFRSQERTRYGGYGDLPIVAESEGYGALASPTDEKATYTAAKRGGTEDVTLEMIKNDDVSAISRIPLKLSRAAKRTLAKFVLDFLRNNPNIYDGQACFHATHNNLFATALSAVQLGLHRLAMLKQAELNSADRLGIAPKYLVIPFDLQETAVNLFNRSTNLDKTFIQELVMTVIPVWYWTDTNDWCTVADPADIPTIEIGFLDGKRGARALRPGQPDGGLALHQRQAHLEDPPHLRRQRPGLPRPHQGRRLTHNPPRAESRPGRSPRGRGRQAAKSPFIPRSLT
jgi:hypothetical protein